MGQVGQQKNITIGMIVLIRTPFELRTSNRNYDHLVDPKRDALPPLRIKLRVIKNFVKATDKEGFECLPK